MTKIEYLKQLEDELRYKISEQEMYDIMRDYAEYFEEGKKQGKTDKQIIEALGIPYVVAKQILGETPDNLNTTIKKSTANLKSSFNNIKESAKDKYKEHKDKSSAKKSNREYCKTQQPKPPRQKRPRREGNVFVDVLSALLKVALWIFLFIPLIVSAGATGIACIIGSIVGIGFLSAFSFSVSTYSIFVASLVLLCILFGGLTIIFGMIWLIKYLLGISDIKQQYAYQGGNPQMNYNGFNNNQNPNNPQYNPNYNQNYNPTPPTNADETPTEKPQEETCDKNQPPCDNEKQNFEVNIKDESILEDTDETKTSEKTDTKEDK